MNSRDLWNENLALIEESVGHHIFETWFKDIKLKSIKDTEICLSVPNAFFEEWLRKRYYQMIVDNITRLTNRNGWKIAFSVRDGNKKGSRVRTKKPQSLFAKKPARSSNVNEKYNFEHFVVGSCNQFAHAASLAVAKRPGKSYNPLFIYGGVGLGKTHLLHAIGSKALDIGMAENVLYISTEQFTNEVINCIRNDRMEQFRQKYRNIDILLIDDIQFLAGKERTQEEFFHTFNTLYEINKQIVISSDRFPKEINNIEERLSSRFEWGLIADIQVPDIETRIAILKDKSAIEKIDIDDEVAAFLAQHIKNNIRELEGSLTRLGAFSSLTGQKITIELAKNVLRDIIKESRRVLTIDVIQKVVAEKYHLRVSDLKSKKRAKHLVLARQVAMYLCRKLTTHSFPDIGNGFGGKDHTTVMHACNQIEKKKEESLELEKLIDVIIKELKI